MQIIKPTTLGLLHRSLFIDGRYQLCISPLIWFSLSDATVLSEQSGWKKTVASLDEGQVLDACAPKGFAEVLLSGLAHSPNGVPVESTEIGFSLGDVLRKQAVVFGDQQLETTNRGLEYSPIKPFSKLPLSWQRSFGGPGLDENLDGVGYVDPETELQIGATITLPNLRRTIHEFDKDRRALPIAFGPMPITSPIIQSRAGTYDETWLDSHYPGLAPDHHPGVYNMAQEDQWYDNGRIIGDEAFELWGVTNQDSPLKGCLPGLRARAFVHRKKAASAQIEAVETLIDTVWFFPEQEMGVLIYRGLIDIADSDALDVASIMVAYEKLTDPKRSDEYYAKVHDLRTNKETAINHVFNHTQLTPEKTDDELAKLSEEQARAQAALEAKIDQGSTAIKAQIETQQEKIGDASELPDTTQAKPSLPAISPEAIERGDIDLTELMDSVSRLMAEQKQLVKETEAKLQQAMSDHDLADLNNSQAQIHLDDIVAEIDQRFMPVTEIPEANISAAERERLQQQLNSARLASPSDTTQAGRFSTDVKQYLRRCVVERLERNETLAKLDLSGSDLSDLDLSGRDLSGAMFESAILDRCNLTGARLDRAVLTNASAIATLFDRASMQRANLSGLNAEAASFRETDLSQAVALKSKLPNCDFGSAVFAKALFTETNFSNSKLMSAHLRNARFVKCDLEHINLSNAEIFQCLFIEANFQGLIAQHARLTRTIIAQANLSNADFSFTEFDRVQLGGDIDLSDASFRQVRAATVGLLGSDLSGANLDQALFKQSNFSEAVLRKSSMREAGFYQCLFSGANFSEVDAQNANFAESLLRKTVWQDSILEHAEFYGANAKESQFHRCQLKDVLNFPSMVEVAS